MSFLHSLNPFVWLLAAWHYASDHKFLAAYALLLTFSLWPTRYASHFVGIPGDEIFGELLQETTANVTAQYSGASAAALPACAYHETLTANQFMYTESFRTAVIQPADIRPGGEFMPADCRPLFSTAIIVVYRQRERQLNQFLIYMHNYLRKQRIHYRIYIVEQFDARPFNRAKLFNIGYDYARRAGFPCVILHDVDLMPMRLGQLYACSRRPRHMCASLDEFRFNLPYWGLFGGAVAISAQQFELVNGMSNMFEGWGGEDDDLYGRLTTKQLQICRFAAEHSQYAMLLHAKEPKSADRLMYLRTGPQRFGTDGLNSLRYVEREYKEHALFTHALVET